jgi:hypothetical protein
MAHSNGRIKAGANFEDDIAYVLGVASGDIGKLCRHANNNKYSFYKPMAGDGASKGYVTAAERKTNFQSLTPEDLASLRSTSTFATVPTPVPWGYKSRVGFMARAYDYLKIDTDLSQIASDWGYDANAQSPMQLNADVTVVIATTATGGTLLCPTFKYNEQSANAYGTANIALYLRDLVFRMYGNRENISAWKLPSSYDDIFNANGALTTGVWRFAIGLAVLTSASGPYKWIIISSVQPLSVPFVDSNFGTTMYDKMINPSACQTVANAIKYAVRNYGQTVIPCIPFLACNLKYYADGTTNPGWRFTGGSYERAITFPNGDKFNITPSGFATTIAVVYVGFRVAYTNSNSASQNVSSLTWYQGQLQTYQGQPYMFINLPRPGNYSYCIMELTFKIRTHFGQTSNVVAGMLISSGDSAGQLYDNSDQALSNISGEWIDTDHTYKVRCMGSNLYTLMKNSPASVFPLTDTEGFDMYFDNTQLAARQHKMDAGTGIALQTS